MAQKIVVFTGPQSATWTVPANVTSITAFMWGAPTPSVGTGPYPGGPNTYPDEAVGFVQGTLTVTAGTNYVINTGGRGAVGSYGGAPAGGFNGGGAGGINPSGTTDPGSYSISGGGATDFRAGGSGLANRTLVAGGAGGGVWSPGYASAGGVYNPATPNPPYPGTANTSLYYQPSGSTGNNGTVGGFGGGGNGADGSNVNANPAGGKGATGTAGGAGGPSSGNAGAAGTSGQGGAGGNTANEVGYSGTGGGGGGGGYFGGGGGGSGEGASGLASTSIGGGGGGGSNFASSAWLSVVSASHTNPTDSIGYFQTLYNNGVIALADFNALKAALQSGQGVAILQFDDPPGASTFSNPVNNAYFDATQPLEIDWTFNSPVTGQTQSKFDIKWTDVNTLATGTTTVAGSTGSFTYAANFFTAGHSYTIQVRTYDQTGSVGPYATLNVNALTTALSHAATITAPANGATVSATPFNVTWTIDAGKTEHTYQVVLRDTFGNVLNDSGVLFSTRINLSTNPSFETDMAGWSALNGAPTFAKSTAFAKIGSASGAITWGTTGAFSAQAGKTSIATVPGQKYWISLWLTDDWGATHGSMTYLLEAISASTGVIASATVAGPTVTGTFVQVSFQFTAADTTTTLALGPQGSMGSGFHTYLDQILIEYNPTNAAKVYFDGTNLNGNTGSVAWTGTTNDSTSTLTPSGGNILTYSETAAISEPMTVTVTYSTTDNGGLTGPSATNSFTLNVSPPGAPSATATPNPTNGTITIAVTNGASTVSNDIYRTDVTHGLPEMRIAHNLGVNPTFVDYTAATNTLYTYRIRAYSAGGGYVDIT